MKTTLSLLLATALAGTGFAQTTTWYGTNDNRVAAGSSATSAVAVAWQDTFLNQFSPNLISGGNISTVANPEGAFNGDGNWTILSFGALGIAPGTIGSASLFMSFDGSGSFPPGVTNTWNIYGYTGVMNEGTMNYNNSFAGNIPGTAYSSFTTTGSYTPDSWISFDVTAALTQYALGNITGLVIGNYAPAPDPFDGTTNRVTFNTSNDSATVRPGLQVTTIPEPSAALLGGLGVLALLRRRRA